MGNKYLKPMLDTGSPRVFNINQMTRKLMEANPESAGFFHNKQMNNLVLIKDAVPESDRTPLSPAVGTKLYFPFNELNIYEGGRTIFLHDRVMERALLDFCGEDSVDKTSLAEDLRVLRILDRLPSLDPFLLKDVFLREGIKVNDAYFEVSEEAWNLIETFMLQKFEPLVKAAFPDIDAVENKDASDDKARQLIDKIWEARDMDALDPLITAFRLPRDRALEIFSSWRGIVYYSYQYQSQQVQFVDLIKWLKENETPIVGATATEAKELKTLMTQVVTELRREWQSIETIVRKYQDSYNKMFRDKIGSGDFLDFLKNSDKTYWTLGNSLGKANHAIYCWDVMTNRFKDRKLPWPQLLDVMRMLGKILEPEKKSTTSVSW